MESQFLETTFWESHGNGGDLENLIFTATAEYRLPLTGNESGSETDTDDDLPRKLTSTRAAQSPTGENLSNPETDTDDDFSSRHQVSTRTDSEQEIDPIPGDAADDLTEEEALENFRRIYQKWGLKVRKQKKKTNESDATEYESRYGRGCEFGTKIHLSSAKNIWVRL
jgi:hypothetical protein